MLISHALITGSRYPVRILDVDAATGTYRVQFLTFQEYDNLTAQQLRPLHGILASHVGVRGNI